MGREKRPVEHGRWSSEKKLEVVLRVLRSEDLDTLSRELGVTAAQTVLEQAEVLSEAWAVA